MLLAGDVVFGSPDAALALGAALTVVGTYLLARELIARSPGPAGRRRSLMLGVADRRDPGGIYLGYLFTLGLGLLFVTAVMLGGPHRAARAASSAAGCSWAGSS